MTGSPVTSGRCWPPLPELRGPDVLLAGLCVDCGHATVRYDATDSGRGVRPRCHGPLPPLRWCSVCELPLHPYLPGDATTHMTCELVIDGHSEVTAA